METGARMMKNKITICNNCLRASCWQGMACCDKYKTAGTVEKTVDELKILKRENPMYWAKALQEKE